MIKGFLTDHFFMNGMAISAIVWLRVSHPRGLITMKRALSRVIQAKNKATLLVYLMSNLLISSVNLSLLLGPTPKETY
jgi:hypothetical protein